MEDNSKIELNNQSIVSYNNNANNDLSKLNKKQIKKKFKNKKNNKITTTKIKEIKSIQINKKSRYLFI